MIQVKHAGVTLLVESARNHLVRLEVKQRLHGHSLLSGDEGRDRRLEQALQIKACAEGVRKLSLLDELKGLSQGHKLLRLNRI